MKIVFLTTNDQVNRNVLHGIAEAFPPLKTLCFFWDSPGTKKRPLLRKALKVFDALARNWADKKRTKQISQRLETGMEKFPDEQVIAFREANSKATVEMLTALKPDLIVVCGSPILKERIFSIPTIGTINIHFGISSAYRGQHTLLWPMMENRFDQIGATIHLIDKGIDTGSMLFTVYPDVAPGDDEVSLELNVAKNIVKPFVEMIREIESSQQKQLTGEPQELTGKEIRYRDLKFWNSTMFAIKSKLGLIKIPTIASRVERFYKVS